MSGVTGAAPPYRAPLSKSAYVLDSLRREISDGRLEAGAAIIQEDVAKRLGVSQTPVREALRHLEAEGAVVYVPHRGATVAEMPPAAAIDFYYARAELEALVTRLAAERWTESQMADLEDRHRDLGAIVDEADQQTLVERNREFHFALFSVGSPTIAPQIRAMWTSLPFRANRVLWDHRPNIDAFLGWHGRILEALRQRDGEKGAVLMRAHVLEVIEMRGLTDLGS